MGLRFYRHIFAVLAFTLLCAASARAAGTLFVEGLRYGEHAERTRIVIDFSDKADFRAFLIDGPPRLAVDVPPSGWRASKTGVVANPLIKGYRSGRLDKENLTRIVFDLAKPAVVVKTYVLAKDAFNKDRVVIDLQPSSQALFAARTSDVYGNRDILAAAARYDYRPPAPVPPPSMLASARDMKLAAIALPARKPAVPDGMFERPRYTVVIDAGHGGDDPGAQASGVTEKHLTLTVAKELKRQLEETGRYRVVLTRDRDVYVKLRRRLALSREAGGDLFISLHADKIGRNTVRGASIYTLSETASDAETEQLAEGENNAGLVAGVDLAAESEDVAGILLDLAMREKMNESNMFARMMEQALRRKNVRLLPNSHRSAGFAVLKAPDVPAILIEMGFLSSPEEAKLLNSSAFQRNIASAIVEGVDSYFRKMQALQKVH